MINEIEKSRADTVQFFNPNSLLPGSEELSYSPTHNFFLKSTNYRQSHPNRNWIVTKIEIYQTFENKKIFEFLRNYDTNWHCWINQNGNEYLVCSEDFEGQSVFDLTTMKFYSFFSPSSPFILVEYIPSPDNLKLAVVGCYWACGYELVIYDISNITQLPFREFRREEINEKSKKWINNSTFYLIDNDNGEKEILCD